MEMPKPTEAHKKLMKICGSWIGEEHMHPSPWDPKGGVATARIQNRIALDGFIVIQDYEQERDGRGGFRGHGVFRWDDAVQCYVLHWFDSMGMAPNEFKGNFQGDLLTMTSKGPMGYNRGVWDYSKPGQCSFRMDVSPDGRQWQTFVEGNYKLQS